MHILLLTACATPPLSALDATAGEKLPDTSPVWAFRGDEEDEWVGNVVAGLGDIDGDGYDDIGVSPERYDGPSRDVGRVWVFYGGPGGPSVTADWEAVGTARDQAYGNAIHPAGDVNADGFADVIVSSWVARCGSITDCGQVELFLGSAAGLGGTAAWTARGRAEGEHYGYDADAAGDVNGDGYADLIIGVPGAGGDQGRVEVFLGSATGLGRRASWTAVGPTGRSFFGKAVAGAGDVDGNGYDDVLVGAPFYEIAGRDEGAAMLYRGGFSGLSRTGTTLTVADLDSGFDTPDQQLGTDVDGAGDLDGDGFDDIVIGAPWADTSPSAGGAVYVFRGGRRGVETAPSTSIWGMNLGFTVAGGGDVDADGYDDLVLGQRNDAANFGHTFVHRGGPAGVETTPAWDAEAALAGTSFGYIADVAGDVDGDGADDVIVGAVSEDKFSCGSCGAAYVYTAP